ncbi:MAG: DUF3365 domain-containing protein [Sedimenticola sp.]
MMMEQFKKWLIHFSALASGRILVFLGVLLILLSVAINLYLANIHAEDVARAQAKTMFDHIVLTRSWNARHGGVYVPITDGTKPNPYLKVPKRDVVTSEGDNLTKINPAYMTRQVSELAQESEGVQFHITSLQPIRPQNAPTPWEREALERFEQGERETGVFLHKEHKYRYMAPLFTTKGCLKCHSEQGYKLGDIRGGISVTHPVQEILHVRERQINITLISHTIVLIIGYIVFMLYRNSRQRLESIRVDKEAAEQANAFKSSFIANISHELRTPLNAIIGMSHILDEEDLQSKQKSHVKTINDAGRQLDGVINQMLDFSRVDTGSLEVNHLPLKLGRLVQECVDLVKEKARQKGLSLAVDYPENAGQWMLGDAQRIREILLHILDNAIKFTESGGVEVMVSVEPKGDTHYEVAITVEDSGIGMDRYLGRQAQHDFIQAEDYRTRKQGGLGLGLTMSRRLLELMGGSLGIESEIGRGTKVTIRFLLECVNEELIVTGSPTVPEEAEKISDAAVEPGKEEKVKPFVLSGFQRQQLDEELSELMVLVDSDYTHAVEKLDAMLIHYQGSDYHVDLVAVSEKMASFDSDGVMEICQSVQEKLSQDNR